MVSTDGSLRSSRNETSLAGSSVTREHPRSDAIKATKVRVTRFRRTVTIEKVERVRNENGLAYGRPGSLKAPANLLGRSAKSNKVTKKALMNASNPANSASTFSMKSKESIIRGLWMTAFGEGVQRNGLRVEVALQQRCRQLPGNRVSPHTIRRFGCL